MDVRKYHESDRESLIALWNAVFPDAPEHNEPGAVIDAKQAVDDLIFVAEEDGEIIGACMAGYDGHRGWLYSVGVSADHRRLGAGAALVSRAVSTLKARGCMKVNLQVRAESAEVEAFYASLGFVTENRISMAA